MRRTKRKKPNFESYLLMEAMKSDIIERTSDALHTAFGKWKLIGVDDLTVPYFFDPRDVRSQMPTEYRHRYSNEAIPIVVDIIEDSYGELSTERIRSHFIWEDDFDKFNDLPGVSNWIDTVMFTTTLPKDYKYTTNQKYELESSIGREKNWARWITEYSFLPVDLKSKVYWRMRRETNFRALDAAHNAGLDFPPMQTVGANIFKLANDEIHYIDDVFRGSGYVLVNPRDFEPRYEMRPPWLGSKSY